MANRPTLGELSKIGLGCWQFGAPGGTVLNAKEVASLLDAARERGVNHFDTAQDYGDGRSEELVGGAIGAREDVFVATKSHLVEKGGALRSVDESRKRLKRDIIDLFYIHWPRTGVDPRPMLNELETLREKGTIRYIGVSNFSVADMERGGEVARIDAHQLCYNLLWRFPERDVIPYCVAHDITLVSYSSLAQGILAGRMSRTPQFAADDPRQHTVYYDPGVWDHVYEGVEAFKREAAGTSLSQLAIRWIIARRTVASVLVGVRSEAQLENNVAALDLEVPDATLRRLTELSDETHQHVPDEGNIFKYHP